ncbi:helicase-related protein [Synechococcus sp. HK01-R]|uniref:helicase-related protein n=1 Tax=Synechococcus sp. HK01-R TaxID=2751171 RepID=UPI0016236F04|nr:helicase-related protein [Synechococcus sp. HK01-R]QNG26151.1 DEAD/DEAH box helicase [Synechococcus sp. HK01-R]
MTLTPTPAAPIDIPSPGSIVKVRGREWIALPQSSTEKQEQVLKLRPLGGGDQTIATLYWPLEGAAVKPASFDPPDPAQSGSQSSALLLRDALLLKLRAGAGPFRSLGNVALEPRPYQLVPLLMALKQAVTRVLIADEVGLGKTVEALLIARELFDRGEIRQITVICPPHLCEKWRADMIGQFNLAAEVVRPGTAQKLERGLPAGKSIFDVIPFTVVSLDWIKSDRNRESFLRSCGEFVIVDEAHTCAARKGGGRQQRFELLRGLSAQPDRHLVLLTATPHSGDTEAFDNLLALLDPKFSGLSEMPEGQRRKDLRDDLGNYFVQRRRQDLKEEWGTNGADFPDRETREAEYKLSGDWAELFHDVLGYAKDLVQRSAGESKLRQRMSWWAALALLRCVSSSPAAASASLRTKLLNLQTDANGDRDRDDNQVAADLEAMASLAVLDGADEGFSGEEAAPGADLAIAEDAEQLQDLIARADLLRGKAHDPKLKQLIKELNALLKEGFRPVIFCRFRPTAYYLAEQLKEALPKRSHVVTAVTGDLPPEERVLRIQELEAEVANEKVPVLVATDCLSEGIDLQHTFDAVVHYDLCWNPTRHEQREGRVDRFGQARTAVRALMLHGGSSNPVDDRVRTVILEKEKTIRKELGVSVPIPGNANSITQAVLSNILQGPAQHIQGSFDLELEGDTTTQLALDATIDAEWTSAKDNAKKNQAIFAQRSLKPEEALGEWERMKESLGSEEAVERLVVNASRRLNLPIGPIGASPGTWELDLSRLEDDRTALRERLRNHDLEGRLRLSFRSPAQAGSQLLSRSHPLVVELADFVAERALSGLEPELAARASVIRTKAVSSRTQLLVLRLRHQLHQDRWTGNGYDALPDLLVEECLTVQVKEQSVEPLEGAAALELLEAAPTGNVDPGQRQQWLKDAVAALDALQPALKALAERRAQLAEDDHRRVREASLRRGESLRMRFNCEPAPAVDVIGLFLLLPAPTL